MTTRDDLLNQGYTNQEIDNALNNIIPASSLAAGMPMREDMMKSNYILASLSGSGNTSLTSGGIQNLYTQNLLQFAAVRDDGYISYTKNGSVWEQPTTNLNITYDITGWNTALVIIKSAGGGGTPANDYNHFYYGENHGNVAISSLTKAIRLWSGPSALVTYAADKGNQGEEGMDFAFLVDVSNITTITITLGLGGISPSYTPPPPDNSDSLAISSHSTKDTITPQGYSGEDGGPTKFGNLITVYGGSGGGYYSEPYANNGGTDGKRGAIQFMKIN